MKSIMNSNYLISKHGTVKNSRTGRELTQHTTNGGKYKVSLSIDGKKHTRYVHRLVAEAFIDNVECKQCVDHIDGDNSNNNVNNLRWCTDIENQSYRVKQGIDGSDSIYQRVRYGDKVYDSIRGLSHILATRRGCKPETARKAIKSARHGTIRLYGEECSYV